MASYDLKCRSCGSQFEVFVRGFLQDSAKVCPDCGGQNVEQRFTGFGGVIGLSSTSPTCVDTGRCEPERCSPSASFG